MTKLIIQFCHEFEAGPISAIKNHELTPLNSDQIFDLINSSTKSDFSLRVTFLDPEHGWPMVGFEMFSKPSRKSDIFEWKINQDTGIVIVKVNAQLESKALRSGVAPTIQALKEQADLRLIAFECKGGEWKGFTANVAGQEDDDFKNWFRIREWELN